MREHGKSDKNLVIERYFDSALPIAQVRDDIERLFSMTSELDAVIRVEALQAGSTAATLELRRFDIALVPDEDREVTLDTDSLKRLIEEKAEIIEVFGRPFFDLAGQDHELETAHNGSRLQWTVPEGCGPWFVYAKIDGVTRSRPLHVDRRLLNNDGNAPYIAAVANANRHEREAQILGLLANLETGQDVAFRSDLGAFIASLDPGLPPQAFDVFRLLPQRRNAAVYMAVNAEEAAFARIINLDQKLPITWPTTTPETWVAALNQKRGNLLETLRSGGIPAKMAGDLADGQTINRIEEITRQRPNLALHLAIAARALRLTPRSDAPERLRDAAQMLATGADLSAFLKSRLRDLAQEVRKRNVERQWPTAATAYRIHHPNAATAAIDAPGWAFEVIDAPCAAVAIALGDTAWDMRHERMIRVCRGFDPVYFDEALIYVLLIEWAKPGRKHTATAV